MNFFIEAEGVFMQDVVSALLPTVIGIAVVYLIFYLFMSFGFYGMAKKNNIAKPWIAFIPFVRYTIGGKVIGKGNFFGKKTERFGLIAGIATAIYYLSYIVSNFLTYYVLYWAIKSGYNVIFSLTNSTFYVESVMPSALTGLSTDLSTFANVALSKGFVIFMNVMQYVALAGGIVQIVLMFQYWSNLFAKYKPGMSFVYTVVATLAPTFMPFIEIGGIFVFIFRKREPFDMEEYVKNMQNRNYGNPYGGNPYDNPYQGGYGDPYGRDTVNPPEGDPFEEFSDKNNNGGNDNPFNT